jgi:hypothetical protein
MAITQTMKIIEIFFSLSFQSVYVFIKFGGYTKTIAKRQCPIHSKTFSGGLFYE